MFTRKKIAMFFNFMLFLALLTTQKLLHMYVTAFAKTDLIVTFSISRNTDLKN